MKIRNSATLAFKLKLGDSYYAVYGSSPRKVAKTLQSAGWMGKASDLILISFIESDNLPCPIISQLKAARA